MNMENQITTINRKAKIEIHIKCQSEFQNVCKKNEAIQTIKTTNCIQYIHTIWLVSFLPSSGYVSRNTKFQFKMANPKPHNPDLFV